MVMAPPLALILGPKMAVPLTLLLETFAAAPMLPGALALARLRLIAPICTAAMATVPLGSYLLAGASPMLLRRAISATVIVFALALLSGRRYQGAPRLATSLGVGALSGTMLVATSIGAPPVILYLLSGPDSAAVTRANLTLYVMVLSGAGLVALAVGGLITVPTLQTAALMALPFIGGVMAGSRLFARLSDLRFRRGVMVFMMCVALGVLFA